jgi:hypothetical protein
MTVPMALFVFGGFGMTYWHPMLAGTAAPFPPIVHIHGFIFSTWIIFLMVQPLLINSNNVALHRSVGTFGITVATAMLITSAEVTVLFGRFFEPNPIPDYYPLFYLSVMAVLGFGTLFCLAIRNVRRPEFHKRFMLFATLPVLPPGINRLYMGILAVDRAPLLLTYLTLDALAAAILIHDWRTDGRFHRASLIGAGFLAVQQALQVPVEGSAAFAHFVHALSSLAHYR